MVQQDGSGVGAGVNVVAAATEDASSLDGYAMAPEAPAAERPELLLGAAFVGGLLLAGLVSRLGR